MTVYVGFEIELEKNSKANGTRDAIVASLSKKTASITGLTDHTIKSYHHKPVNADVWRLEKDSSLRSGAEFISPPRPIDESLDSLSKFFNHMNESDCTTTSRCGLHVNISSTGKTLKDINIDSFITKIDTRILFKYWGDRLHGNNRYVQNMSKMITNQRRSMLNFDYSGKSPLKTKLDIISNTFLLGRYNFINLRAYRGFSYFEIRVIGGEDYHKRFDAIKSTVMYFGKLIEEAKKDKLKLKKSSKKFSDMSDKDRHHYKTVISYINRTKNNAKSNEAIFIPTQQSCDSSCPDFVDCSIKRIKNIHSYTIKDITKMIYRDPHLYLTLELPYSNYGMARLTRFNDEERTHIFSAYIKRCIRYVKNIVYSKEDMSNYIMYHACKFMYTKYNKKTCIKYMKENSALIHFDRFIPKDETLRDALWIINCLKDMDKTCREVFIKGLEPNVLDFLLKYKKKGMIILARKRKIHLEDLASKKEKKEVEKKETKKEKEAEVIIKDPSVYWQEYDFGCRTSTATCSSNNFNYTS